VQKQYDIPREGIGQGLVNDDLKPRPARLIETPHSHPRSNEAPEQTGMPAAVECIPGGDKESRGNNHLRYQISHDYAEKRVGKYEGRERKTREQSHSADERRNLEPGHCFA
jgi:hypothetical protein